MRAPRVCVSQFGRGVIRTPPEVLVGMVMVTRGTSGVVLLVTRGTSGFVLLTKEKSFGSRVKVCA